MMVTQQSAAANFGRQCSAVSRLMISAAAALVAAGSAISFISGAGKPNGVAEREPEFLLERAARDDLAVSGRVELVARRSTDQTQLAGTGEFPGRMSERPSVPGEGEHRVGHRDVEMHALPRRVALAQPEQDVDHGRHRAAADVRNECRRDDGLLGRAGLDREQPGEALVVDVVARLARTRAVLAVTGDRAVHDPRIDLADILEAELQPRHDAGTELFDQHIRFLKQRPQAITIAFILQVERDALFAPVEQREGRRLAIEARRAGAHVLAFRTLDLDHLGAGFGQHQASPAAPAAGS